MTANVPVRTLLTVLAICATANAGEPLKTLYDAHEWFKLRDAMAETRAPLLYRGAVAYAFHDLRQAEKDLRRVHRGGPKSEEGIEAHALLISVAQMRGEYRQALSEIRAIQAITPDNRGLENGAAFFSALAEYPKQKVSRRRPTAARYSLHAGNLFLPVSVNGKAANYLLDTGANFSVLSESEAGRLGLKVRGAPGSHGTDAAGKDVPFRIALADRVSVGAFELRNVVFMVGSDDQQPFVDLPAGSRGVLGIPVALAFETFGWSDDGQFQIGFDTPRSVRSEANLCFDGANPVILADYRRNPIKAFLDTGAARTRLMPLFAADFADTVKTAAKGMATVRGVAGTANVEAAVLPEVTVRIGGGEAVLHSPEVLLKHPGDSVERFHVWAGLDLFEHAHKVTIDLRSMKFAYQQQ